MLSNVTPRLSYAEKVIDELRQQYAPFIMNTMIPALTRVWKTTAEGESSQRVLLLQRSGPSILNFKGGLYD